MLDIKSILTGHKVASIVAISLVVGIAVFVFLNNFYDQSKDETHYHAAFHLYVDNELVDLAQPKYMHAEPCSLEKHDEHTPAEEQIAKAHLHDMIGDVVHVHRAEGTWADLFTNIEYAIGESAAGYRMSGAVGSILDQPIIADDRLLILVGQNDDLDEKLAAVPSIGRIREVEQLSESCGAN